MNRFGIVVVAIVGIVSACQFDSHSHRRRMVGAVPGAAEGGTLNVAVHGTNWVCGTAAGLCTCVSIPNEVQSPMGRCQDSDCCYKDASGRCSCRLSTATMNCDAFRSALDGPEPVASCPVDD
jgi:hypothetical protein